MAVMKNSKKIIIFVLSISIQSNGNYSICGVSVLTTKWSICIYLQKIRKIISALTDDVRIWVRKSQLRLYIKTNSVRSQVRAVCLFVIPFAFCIVVRLDVITFHLCLSLIRRRQYSPDILELFPGPIWLFIQTPNSASVYPSALLASLAALKFQFMWVLREGPKAVGFYERYKFLV